MTAYYLFSLVLPYRPAEQQPSFFSDNHFLFLHPCDAS